MKKTFKLKVENKNSDRLLEAIKHEIRKYIKREKRKTLPEDVDFWKFNCKFAKNDEEAKEIDFLDITNCINEAASEGCESFYMEILTSEGIKPKKEVSEDKEETSEEE
ncbi:MAG: DUF6172 family protein [Poseidonibacter sp.]|uniref:DUF6172 family protein n=1 Tax=Poseidonibacter sp. TaxID=2321188 RepID=UPI00359D55B0